MSDEIDRASSYLVARGMLFLISQSLITGIATTAFFVFIARILPNVSDLGLVNGLQTLIILSVTLAGLGLPAGVTRFASSYLGAGKESDAREVYTQALLIALASSAAFFVGTFLFSDLISVALFHDTQYANLVKLASLDILLLSMISFSVAFLYSLQKLKKIAIVSLVNSLLKVSAGIAFVTIGMGVEGIVIGWLIGDSVSLAFYAYSLFSEMRRGPQNRMRPLFSYSLPLYGAAILDFLSTNVDRYLLLILSSLFVVGIYSPALMLGALLLLILGTIDQNLFPYFSRIFGKSGTKSLIDLSRYATRYVFLIFMPLGFVTLASTPVLITNLLGERYVDSILPAQIIVLALTLTSVGTIFNNVLKSSGYTKVFLISNSIALSLQLAISITTIPLLGGIGAAFARVSSNIVLFLYPAYRLKQISGLHFDKQALRDGLAGSIIMALIIFAIHSYSQDILYYLLSLAAAVSSYLILLRFTKTIRIQDIDIMNNILSGRLKWLTSAFAKVTIRDAVIH